MPPPAKRGKKGITYFARMSSPAKKRAMNRVDPVTKSLVEGNTRFALDLYKQLRTTEGNLFLSPYSISSVLTEMPSPARRDSSAA